ncbi:MAG TPA: NAD-binding protein [Gammaproteobacteria bacterium]|nr:NAD-binding protein [Gammaproteobacteria bacterium]
MRAVFIGASNLTVATAKRLLKEGHEVVVIDKDKTRIEELSEELDCGLIHGDGSRPSQLEEVSPGDTEYLFCLSNDDQANIIASLVGRELKFGRVVTRIENSEFEPICVHLGLESLIIPDQEISGSLLDMVEGREPAGLSTVLKGGVRFFTFIAGEKHAGRVKDLALPDDTRVIAITRDDDSQVAFDDTKIQKDDEVFMITLEEYLDVLENDFLKSSD